MRFAKRLSDVCESTQHVCELTVGETTRWRNDQLPSNMQIMTTKTITLRTLYFHVVLNCVICPQILYDIVLYAPHFLPVKFFPKCYFNKVCFELL